MTCTACGKINLAGGVRCAYCGTHFPPAVDFELGTVPSAPPEEPAHRSAPPRAAGLLGSLLILLWKGKSLIALLQIAKVATTVGTMFISAWAYSHWFGWKLAFIFVLCILVHELGHVVVNWRYGLKQTAPMFIPLMGAVIFLKRFPQEPTIESESGAGGPAAGLLASIACLLIAQQTHDPVWHAAAFLSFGINLFNLIPFWQLDGAHVSSVFSPRIWNGILITLLLLALKVQVMPLWGILIVVFLGRLTHEDTGRWQLARPGARIRMAAVFLVLIIGLSYGADRTIGAFESYRRSSMPAASAEIASASRTRADADMHAGPERADLSIPPRTERILKWVMRSVFLGLAAGLWLGTAWMLSRAAGSRMSVRRLVLPASMLVVFIGIYVVNSLFDVSLQTGWTLIGGYFGAAFAGLIYAGYVAARRSPRSIPQPYAIQLARCLAWAVGGALLVAYAANSFLLAGIVMAIVLAYWARYRWMPYAAAAGIYEQLSEFDWATALRRMAISLKPDPASELALWLNIARVELKLARGGPTLEAVEAAERLRSSGAVGDRRPAMAGLQSRAMALAHLERFDETLHVCEEMLAVQTDAAASGAVLFLVHAILLTMARFRGWSDEALAQSEWCLRATPSGAVKLRATLQALKAEALCEQGELEEAATICQSARKSSHDPDTQGFSDNVLAEIALKSGNSAEAEQHIDRAARTMPGHLGIACWRGIVAVRTGKDSNGRTILQELADKWPDEHWGRFARLQLDAA